MAGSEGGFAMRDGLGGRLGRVRETVMRGMSDRIAYYPAGLRMALENVDPLNGFSCAADGVDPDGLAVFACASVGMHTDEENVPRWSEMAYLGPVDLSGGAVHVLHASAVAATLDDIEAWTRAGAVPPGRLGEVRSRVLAPGDCFLLDGWGVHWLDVRIGGRERGRPLGPVPDPNRPCPGLADVDPAAAAGLFASYAADEPIGREAFLRMLDALDFGPPRPRPGRGG